MRRLVLALLLGFGGCQRSEPAPATTSQVAVRDLRTELLEMAAVDQRAREAWIANLDDPAAAARVRQLDRSNTARMKAIIAEHGWPGHRLAGRDGADAAWILVQHADADLAFQKDCLAKLEAAVAAGDADPDDHAYLFDRIAVAENRPQRFGTQFGGDGEPLPIEDEANVDVRRAAVGMITLAEYREAMREMNQGK